MNIRETNLEFNGLSRRNATNRIILHNSGVEVLQSIEILHSYHKNSLGWAGIGYHFYIRKDGSIYRGRPEDTIGAHAYGANSDSIGICFEGNYDVETMGEAQIRAGQELVAYLKEKYGINTVIGHRDVCSTSCPGANFPFGEIANGKIEKPSEPIDERKSIEEIARDVIAGKYGNGEDRKRNLENEGYNYSEVQAKVNEILLGKKPVENTKSIDELAKEVIEGKWGNGEDRKNRLNNAGYDYNAVQRRVNELLK